MFMDQTRSRVETAESMPGWDSIVVPFSHVNVILSAAVFQAERRISRVLYRRIRFARDSSPADISAGFGMTAPQIPKLHDCLGLKKVSAQTPRMTY